MTCFLIGHREYRRKLKNGYLQELRQEISNVLKQGCFHFIIGLSDGLDLILARIVLEHKKTLPDITLEALLTYKGRLNTNNCEFHSIINLCDKVEYIGDEYKIGCFLERIKRLTEQSDLVLAAYDGRKNGGTAFAIEYSVKTGKKLIIIAV